MSGPGAGSGRAWRRFTPAERLARFAVYLAFVAAIVAAARSVEVIPEFIYDAPEQMADMLGRMWPIDVRYYPGGIHAALMESIHIAALGTVLAVAMALPVGFLAARNATPFPLLNLAARLVLVSTRSVNTLVWALLFVAIFGPGALGVCRRLAQRCADVPLLSQLGRRGQRPRLRRSAGCTAALRHRRAGRRRLRRAGADAARPQITRFLTCVAITSAAITTAKIASSTMATRSH